MAAKKSKNHGKTGKTAPKGQRVGSNPEAAEEFADRNDFGIPAELARDKAAAGQDMANRRDHQRIGRGGKSGLRESGVGREDSGPGSSSGGDLDPAYTGITGGGLAQDAPDRITIGPASTTGSSDEFASGPHAEGKGNLKPGTHGDLKNPKGTFHNAGTPGTSAGGGGSGGQSVGAEPIGRTDSGIDTQAGAPGSDDAQALHDTQSGQRPNRNKAPRSRRREPRQEGRKPNARRRT